MNKRMCPKSFFLIIIKVSCWVSHSVFTEENNKITSGSNYDIRMQSIDLIKTYAYGMSKDLVKEKEETKCNNIIKWCKNDYL